MILVSQDRSTAYNFDCVSDVHICGRGIFATVAYEERRPLTMKLGVYESEERAKEVFNDLCLVIGRAETMPMGVVSIAEV